MEAAADVEQVMGRPQSKGDIMYEKCDDLYYSTNFQRRQVSAPQFVYQKRYIPMSRRGINEQMDKIEAQQQTPGASVPGKVLGRDHNPKLPRVQSSTVYSKQHINQELLQRFQMFSESVSPVRVQGRPVYSANVFHNAITRHSPERKHIQELTNQKAAEIPTNTQVKQLRTVQHVNIVNPKESEHAELLRRIRNEFRPQKQRLTLRNGVFQLQ